jgi:hypothetical protein
VEPTRTVIVKAKTPADPAITSGETCKGNERECQTFIGAVMIVTETDSISGAMLVRTGGELRIVNQRCSHVYVDEIYTAKQDITGVWFVDDNRDFCKARWIKFRYTPETSGENVEPLSFWDGTDPSACSEDGKVPVEYPCGEPLCESDVMAFYDPNTEKYQAITTPSAMMGEPETRTLVEAIAGYDCGVTVTSLEYRTFPNSCNPTPDPVETPLGVETPVVVAISSEACGTINYAYQTIRAFVCDNPVAFIDFPINFDGVEFVTAAAFGPPTCTGEAIYTWNPTTNVWDLTTPCTNGCTSQPPPVVTPFPTSVYTETVPCDSPLDGQCGLNLQMGTICQDTSSGAPLPTIVHVPLSLEPVTLVYDVVDNTAEISIYKKTVYVCNWEPANDGTPIPIGPCPPTSSGGP